jgi:hypothetical protein
MMTQAEIVDMITVMENTGFADMKQLITMVTAGNLLEYKRYKFLSGPFKGAEFISNAPNTKWMNRYPNFKIEFISGKLKGVISSSLITYDQRIQEKTMQWLKLL